MSIEAGGAFSGKLESIDGLKLNNRAEIHINKPELFTEPYLD